MPQMIFATIPQTIFVILGLTVWFAMAGSVFWLRRFIARAALGRWAEGEQLQITYVKRGGFFTSPFIHGGAGADTFRVFVRNREGSILKAWVLVRCWSGGTEVRWDETEELS